MIKITNLGLNQSVRIGNVKIDPQCSTTFKDVDKSRLDFLVAAGMVSYEYVVYDKIVNDSRESDDNKPGTIDIEKPHKKRVAPVLDDTDQTD